MVALSPALPPQALSKTAFPMTVPTVRYGLAIDTLILRIDTIREGQNLSGILHGLGLGNQEVHTTAIRFNGLLDVRNLRAGRTYTIIDDVDTDGPDFLTYQPSIYEYIRLDLQNKGNDERVRYPVTTTYETAAGEIESNLWNAMTKGGMSYALTDRMEDALQWSVDFYHVQPDDRFQLYYEKKHVDGEEADPGQVLAARYSTGGDDIYAFYYESPDSSYWGYFGLNGEPMKSTFLKSPVRFARMSSGFNLRRFHPVQKRVKPHLGTDYAAPRGTPILSTADGVIVERGRRGGNGNFVKVRHSKQYTTQYLHMNKFQDGQSVGSRVKQGDIIGYVGSTGLATGPHVCYRFWKDNRQIDHRALKFPPAKAMPDSLLPDFMVQRDIFLEKLNLAGDPVQDTQQQMIDEKKRMEEMKAIKRENAK
ncbi:MAG: murein DD-endopeptidase MepM/ murein hydrolase activator NlpD [Neolewinella sp.]|jgi:murein DD-endopeptidase MepM/ murein hydrolase activator NlpD